jgi:archaeal flagellin FlaB
MIIFIAMVLVAGIAAFILISTSSQLEIRSTTTGSQTISDVSTGVKISNIQGHATANKIDKMVISITPRPGSQSVGVDHLLIELANSTVKCILQYSSTNWADIRSGSQDIYSLSVYSNASSEFGIIVVKDSDSSCSQNLPVINSGDSVMLSVNMTTIFNGTSGNVNILGNIMPEEGAWSIIKFRTPSSLSDPIITLFED